MADLAIEISAQRLEQYCRGVRRSARGTAQALAALTAVQTFLTAVAAPDKKRAAAYREAMEVLQQHIEACRAALLEEHAATLLKAIDSQDAEAVATVHGTLSRSGFQQAMTHAAQRLTPETMARAWRWANTWCNKAERRAAEASGYPDAYDFTAAGIRFGTHAAMKDLVIFLNNHQHGEQTILTARTIPGDG